MSSTRAMPVQRPTSRSSSSPSSANTDPGDSSTGRMACRIGYAAHGVVYLLIGVLAVDAALGDGGQEAQGSAGAIAELGTGTVGTVLLTALALGLLGYSFLRLWQGLGNPANHGDDVKGIGMRVARVASGLMQTALAIFALSLAFNWSFGGAGGGSSGSDSGGGSGRASDLTAMVMDMTAGRWIIGLIGLAIMIGGLAQLGRAIKASFLEDLRLPPGARRWVQPLGRFAYAARFVVFLIIGGFLVVAAVQYDSSEARGLGGALRSLREQPYGPWVLGAVGAGLVAFAVLRGVYARYAIIPRQSH